MEDMGNKAEYGVNHIGVSYHHYGSEAARQDNFNQSGLTPSISPGAQDEASSVTQSAIALGTIITTKEQTDLSQYVGAMFILIIKSNHLSSSL